MPFIKIPGFEGQIYVPDEVPGDKKKHDCADCFSCQFCDDDRCRKCLIRNPHVKKKDPGPGSPQGA
jgi:hypothetical protein